MGVIANEYETIISELHEVVDKIGEKGQELHVEIHVATLCAWSGEFKHIAEPNTPGGADLGETYYVAGCSDPVDVLNRLLSAFYAHGGLDK